ncbi:MAG: hypothetical protein K2N11_06385, partial [Mucispirillum sp.]|nr:hypothetical protein [Mucispirillum sp.]
AIQLKRFGEYNYKYFYSHKELISEDNSSMNLSDGKLIDSYKHIYEESILLGSLVYDKEWIDNKMGE